MRRLRYDMPIVTIHYGSKEISVSIPDANYLETISPRAVQLSDDGDAIIKAALDDPIGSTRLERIARPGDKIAIVVDDYTRPTPASRILPHLLERLHEAGVRKDQITIVFALGTHRAMTKAEIVAKIGSGPAKEYRTVNTSVHEDSDYVSMGVSDLGIPIWMLKEVFDAAVRIGMGSIVPHCDVGYAGGGKILLPGVCAAQTVAANHIKGIDFQGRNLLGASTTIIREDIEDAVARVGLHFIVNAITTSDGQLYALVCGDYIKAYRAGIPYARDVYGVPARRRADITICSAYPADVDFIQVCKSVWSGDKMTQQGGDLIIFSPCTEGVGPYISLPSLMAQDRHDLERRIRSGETGADVTGVMAALAVRLNRIGERVHISMVTDGLSPEVAGEMGYRRYDSVEAALSDALSRQGPEATISVMTHGGYTYPMVSGEEQL
jgi:nickel-dependent lactate racemase